MMNTNALTTLSKNEKGETDEEIKKQNIIYGAGHRIIQCHV